MQNKKVTFTATTNGTGGRKITYTLFVNGEEKQKVTTYKAEINFREQITHFGETMLAYVNIELEGENTSKSNEIIIEDYTIATKEELEIFRNHVNNKENYEGKKILLVEDINLNENKYTINQDKTIVFNSEAEQWTPIGNSDNVFKGELDGQGHTIKGIYIDDTSKEEQGLIGVNEGTIKNLTLEEGNIIAGYCVGGVTGRNYGVIDKVINKAKIEAKGSSNVYSSVGGVCGVNNGKIEKSKNYGNIKGEKMNVGGICGGATGEILNCENLCETVDATGASSDGYCRLGGIVGYSEGKIEQCHNKADVTGNGANIGGIVGLARGVIDQCYNTGVIESLNQNAKGNNTTGGIVGYTYNTVSNCYNTGEIKGTTKIIGGIVGSNVKMSDTVKQEIINCYNIGKVEEINSYYGGIIGEGAGTSNCYYLEGTAKFGFGGADATSGNDTNAVKKTETELKSLTTLGNAFKEDKDKINDGYPILSWQ